METIVDSKLDDEINDERTARNDAINTAINASTSAIITGRKGAIDKAIATERAAIDRSVDSKTGIIDAKVTTLDGKLESERNDRVAAITAEARKRETALNAERSTREAAITAERDARHTAMHAQRTELKNAIANITPDFDAHMATVIQTERSERTAAITAEADNRKAAIAAEANSRDNAIRALDTKVAGDIAEARHVITADIATAVATERDARKSALSKIASGTVGIEFTASNPNYHWNRAAGSALVILNSAENGTAGAHGQGHSWGGERYWSGGRDGTWERRESGSSKGRPGEPGGSGRATTITVNGQTYSSGSTPAAAHSGRQYQVSEFFLISGLTRNTRMNISIPTGGRAGLGGFKGRPSGYHQLGNRYGRAASGQAGRYGGKAIIIPLG